ncbi:MAG: hypothetical protein AAFS11_08650 [Planctomycetota bacterium]
MYVVLTVALVVFMLAVPPLIPAWTGSAVMVVIVLELLCLAVVISLWTRRYAEHAMRVAAALIAGIFVAASVSTVLSAVGTGSPILSGNSPVLGLVFVGIPALVFAVRGFKDGTRRDLGIGPYADDHLIDDDWDEEDLESH